MATLRTNGIKSTNPESFAGYSRFEIELEVSKFKLSNGHEAIFTSHEMRC